MKQTYEELEQMISMQAEALAAMTRPYNKGGRVSGQEIDAANAALSATSETVAAWRAKETEPYKREVAMMRWEIEKCLTHIHPVNRPASAVMASRNSEAAALAYDQEVEQRGAVKAKLELITWLYECGYLTKAAEDLYLNNSTQLTKEK